MKYLKRYKLFELIYQDLQKEYDDIKISYINNIERIKNEYLQEVKDCIVDITDDYTIVSLILNESEIGEEDELIVILNILIDYEQINSFIKDYTEAYNRCESYLGKKIKVLNLLRKQTNGHYYALFSNDGYMIHKIQDLEYVQSRSEGEKIQITLTI